MTNSILTESSSSSIPRLLSHLRLICRSIGIIAEFMSIFSILVAGSINLLTCNDLTGGVNVNGMYLGVVGVACVDCGWAK